MDFYINIADYYNLIFPLNKQKLQFLAKSFSGYHNLLDVGCATGEYAEKLSELGFKVTGIDLDKKMIVIARENYPALQFKVQNMFMLDNNRYDGIYCIGNTLVHVKDLRKLISVFARALKKGGKIVLQIINYDKIINLKTYDLPVIKNDKLTFKRHYIIENDKNKFETILSLAEKDYYNMIYLYPICSQDLITLLKEENFDNIKAYNDFTKESFTEDSFALVIEAMKIG